MRVPATRISRSGGPPTAGGSPFPRRAPLPGRGLLACLAILATAGCALQGGRFVLIEENDTFNVADPHDTDRDYTQGIAAALTLTDEDTPEWARAAARSVPLFASRGRVHLGILAGQEIYTPAKRYTEDPLPEDRPYAAWLYAGMALQVPVMDEDPILRRDRIDQLELDLGVVGPSAQGEAVQNYWHRQFHLETARGWRNQVGGTPGAVVAWETRWRVAADDLGRDLGWDLLPRVRVRAGNVHTDGAAGAMVRIGWRLPRDFGPMALDSHGLSREEAPDGAFFALHAAFEMRAVARDLFLEGGGGSPSVTPERFPRTLTVGLTHGWGPVTFVFEQHFVSPEFRENRRFHTYTTMMLVLDRYF